MTKKSYRNIFLILIFLFVISIYFDVSIFYDFVITPIFLILVFLLPILIGIHRMILPKNDGFTFWINPILKLTSVLVKIDGRILEKENKRVNTYLLNEFESFTGRRKMRLFTKYLQKEIAVNSIFEEINDSYENKEKIQVINFLIGVAVSDQLLTDTEKIFIEKVADKISISRLTLKSIFALHNYITEEQLNQKKTYSPSVYKRTRAYTILGVEQNATQEEIKKAYRELVKLFHPDKLIKKRYTQAALEKAKTRFQEVKDAYELLQD